LKADEGNCFLDQAWVVNAGDFDFEPAKIDHQPVTGCSDRASP
jgi:hypothetical protein